MTQSSASLAHMHESQCSWAFEAFSRNGSALLAIVATIVACGCARHARVAHPSFPGRVETGIASWYGEPYHGRKTASGEVYDMHQLTAAHRSLPFGTWVEVTNAENGTRVAVRINDRGPFVDGRIIDLSRAAAERIGLIGPGIARVRVKVIEPPL
jgi:rare lipoprotein A